MKLMKIICNVINEILNLLLFPFPVKRKVLFYNILENYNDNPYVISKYLHSVHPEIDQYWVYSRPEQVQDVPKFIRVVKKNSLLYWFHKNTAKILIDNSVGFQTTNNAFKGRFLIKKQQRNYSTWHGTPLKMIGADNKLTRMSYNNFFTSSTHMILGSNYELEVFSKAYNSKLNILLLGNPRNDCLFTPSSIMVQRFQDKYGVNGKKMVLFAPTYRDNTVEGNIDRIDNQVAYKIIECLQKRFDGDWFFAYRLHHFDTTRKLQLHEETGRVINVCECPDMNTILSVSDVLITDYSGSLFDYMLLRRPCFLFMPDYEEYGHDRGMYLTADDLPWPHSHNVEVLLDDILEYNEAEIMSRVESFLENTGNTNDGRATERVCEMILRDLKIGRNNNEI